MDWSLIVSVAVALVTGFFAIWFFLWRHVEKRTDELHTRVDETHERINGVKDTYVRRDDLDAHLKPFAEGQREIKEELKGLRQEIRELARGKV